MNSKYWHNSSRVQQYLAFSQVGSLVILLLNTENNLSLSAAERGLCGLMVVHNSSCEIEFKP